MGMLAALGAGGAGGAAGITDPTQIAGCTVWYTADAGVYQDFVGGTPAVSDGDPVGAWADSSGNSHYLQQAVAAAKPALKLAIQNGRAVVRFDGVQTFLPGVAFTLDQPHTRFVVMAIRSAPDGSHVPVDGPTSQSGQMLGTGSGTASLNAGTELDGPALDANWHIWRGTFNGTSSKVTLDNGAVTTGDAGSANPGGIILGTDGGMTLFCDCDIGEVIEYSAALVDADVARVVHYLNQRWNIF